MYTHLVEKDTLTVLTLHHCSNILSVREHHINSNHVSLTVFIDRALGKILYLFVVPCLKTIIQFSCCL